MDDKHAQKSALWELLGVSELLAQFDALAARMERLAEQASPPPETFSLTATAEILGVTPKSVRRLLDEGRLWKVEGLDSGDRVRIPRAAIDVLLRRPD